MQFGGKFLFCQQCELLGKDSVSGGAGQIAEGGDRGLAEAKVLFLSEDAAEQRDGGGRIACGGKLHGLAADGGVGVRERERDRLGEQL